jgi:hypothetical protein
MGNIYIYEGSNNRLSGSSYFLTAIPVCGQLIPHSTIFIFPFSGFPEILSDYPRENPSLVHTTLSDGLMEPPGGYPCMEGGIIIRMHRGFFTRQGPLHHVPALWGMSIVYRDLFHGSSSFDAEPLFEIAVPDRSVRDSVSIFKNTIPGPAQLFLFKGLQQGVQCYQGCRQRSYMEYPVAIFTAFTAEVLDLP